MTVEKWAEKYNLIISGEAVEKMIALLERLADVVCEEDSDEICELLCDIQQGRQSWR